MRSVVYSLAISLDGFIAGPEEQIDWLFDGAEEDYGMDAFFKTIDTVFMGRKTQEIGAQHGMPAYEGMKNYVFSRTHPEGPVNELEYVSGEPSLLVNQLKKEEGKDMWLVGGGDLARQFLEANLVDTIVAAVHPVILGDGIPFMAPAYLCQPLYLESCIPYPDGLVLLRYRISDTDKPA